ncbi:MULTISPECIES: FISUMP domain-containing protein [unclassified Fibrobacter]|uniref:FISUMP domain-containing protein n=1 Tax=unclassified Fibrobacter TaxID=2634177 RepID=UPI000D6D10B1|nr:MULTISPECIES: FISUMP domain-containing protein [unclassified Fibrobacter]PWJ55079.1 uncharacterized protein (TIGR02145 family) [Fibrobacter sp. UWR4]PZW61946.1 uncharacterized protein (TIGR02145 family) [Fibrobacter sp. UWR1]
MFFLIILIFCLSFIACGSDENSTAPQNDDFVTQSSSSINGVTNLSSVAEEKVSSSSKQDDNPSAISSSMEQEPLSSSSAESPSDKNTFVDERDGRVYKMTTIGDQIWMAEHLKYVPTMENSLGLGEVSLCIDYLEDNCEKYGRYYQWSTAIGIDRYDFSAHKNKLVEPYQGLCPSGWHIPSAKEFKTMMDFLDGNYDAIIDPSLLGTDTYGFSLTNTGRFGANDDDYASYRYFEKDFVYLWSISGDNFQRYTFYIRNIEDAQSGDIARTIGTKLTDTESYLPVRCIKD